MATLEGDYLYYSFRPDPEKDPPSSTPWSPAGKVVVTTDEAGKVSGKLTFPSVEGLELTINGSVTPGVAGKLPEGVELTAEGGDGSVNKLRGYFIDGSHVPLVVGTIVATSNDLAEQPDGTSGPFVLLQITG